MSAGKAFFDTSVLLYMYGSEPAKQARAIHIFRHYHRAGLLVISTQIVQEFYSAGSRKLRMPAERLRELAVELLELPLVLVGPAVILSAMLFEQRYGIPFWDALVLSAAESAGAEVLYTEDLNHGQLYGNVAVRNPFLSTNGTLS
jgi:predicted nucleic acid-binding protein